MSMDIDDYFGPEIPTRLNLITVKLVPCPEGEHVFCWTDISEEAGDSTYDQCSRCGWFRGDVSFRVFGFYGIDSLDRSNS